jgi:hypothetical protein
MVKPTFSTGDVPSADQVNDWFVNIEYVRKSANESVTSSTTYQDDDQLLLPVEANATYEVTVGLRYDATTAADIKIRIVGPSGYSFGAFLSRLHPDATSSADASVVWIIGGGTDALGGLGIGTDGAAFLQGTMITTGTAGNCQLQWAQNASSATATTLFAGSYMRLLRVS